MLQNDTLIPIIIIQDINACLFCLRKYNKMFEMNDQIIQKTSQNFRMLMLV